MSSPVSKPIPVSDSYTLEIPPDLRESLNMKPGQMYMLLPKGDSVVLVRVPELAELRGIAKGADTSNYRDREPAEER